MHLVFTSIQIFTTSIFCCCCFLLLRFPNNEHKRMMSGFFRTKTRTYCTMRFNITKIFFCWYWSVPQSVMLRVDFCYVLHFWFCEYIFSKNDSKSEFLWRHRFSFVIFMAFYLFCVVFAIDCVWMVSSERPTHFKL